MTDKAYFVFDPSPEGRVFLRADDVRGTPAALDQAAFGRLGDAFRLQGLVAHDESSDRWALFDGPPGGDAPEGFVALSRRELPAIFGYDLFVRAGVAFQMMNLARSNQFCGVCGAEMQDHKVDRARECPACGQVVYPVMSPAIIVAVTKEDRLLMGHGVNFPSGRYSVLAGFVEPGETFEEAVHREIFEESQVRVRNVRYFGSQPWPFPNSMMIGFKADWESGDPRADGAELTDVKWFARNELPKIPPSVSISRMLIDDWQNQR